MSKKIIALLLTVLPIFIFSQSLKQTKQKLEKTNKVLKEKLAEKRLYITHQRNIRIELAEIDKDIRKIEEEIKTIQNKISDTEKEINLLEQNLELLNVDENFYRHILNVYVNKYINEYFLTTPIFEENFYRRIKKDILVSYARQLSYTKSQIDYITKLKHEYNLKKEKLNDYYKNLLYEKSKQKQLFLKKGQLLEKYKLKQKKVEQEIAELKKTQSDLEALLKKLQIEEQKRQKKEQFVKQRTQQSKQIALNTKFIKPLNGEIIEKFGKRQICSDGSCVINNGVVIQGLSNSNVVSIESGKVLFVSNNFRSYGKMVIIEHKNNIHTIYGRLGEILVSEGDFVSKNQPIGKTDSSGQIYFELRSNFVAVNPELYFE